ncbi:MAG: 50S ribosomal protein L29 [Thermorudis peleae]|nr:50S ribosomal protein L29 [Thermorudis peleae]
MKAAELRAMTNEQLHQLLADLRSEWRDLRFDAALGRLTNTMRIRQVRKDIARILTILTERERAALAEQGLLPPPKRTRRERKLARQRQRNWQEHELRRQRRIEQSQRRRRARVEGEVGQS